MPGRTLGLVLCLWLMGCSQPEPPSASLAGELAGPTSLPPGSRANVIIEEIGPADRAAQQVAEISQRAEQTPIRFQLNYQPAPLANGHYYNVRARIEDASGTLLWVTDRAYPLGTNPMRIALTQVTPPPRVFDCDGETLRVVFGPEQASLSIGEQHWTLAQVRSASGGRYQNDTVEFWTKGNEAQLMINQSERRCRLAQ